MVKIFVLYGGDLVFNILDKLPKFFLGSCELSHRGRTEYLYLTLSSLLGCTVWKDSEPVKIRLSALEIGMLNTIHKYFRKLNICFLGI
jgi:hypothetical protein